MRGAAASFSTVLCLALSLVVPLPQAQRPAGTLTPKPLDPGRPWGWAVRAFMENPQQKLYNTAKQKLLDGKQVFSHTISRFDIDAYHEKAVGPSEISWSFVSRVATNGTMLRKFLFQKTKRAPR